MSFLLISNTFLTNITVWKLNHHFTPKKATSATPPLIALALFQKVLRCEDHLTNIDVEMRP